MKVVLFCGGLGMRMRPLAAESGESGVDSSDVPKPMVSVGGQRPLLWHVMKYYAHWGHKDFILCLGYRGDVVKNYFLHYSEYLTNDFILEGGGVDRTLLTTDIHDWRITFVDTGLSANVGERLRCVRDHLEGEDYFIANYSDGLTDLPFPAYHDAFRASGKKAGFMAIRPPYTTHVVDVEDDGTVDNISPIRGSGIRINGGYFIFHRSIFDYLRPGEELVREPFQRLITERQLFGYAYDGFWTCIDTFKEKQNLDEMWRKGETPWQVWKTACR